GRVDTLEGKVATLERQQFSTTTKLTGEVIFAPFAGSDGRVTTVDVNTTIPGIGVTSTPSSDRSNLAFGARARLNFDTSFTGRDLLRTRLQTGSFQQLNRALGSGTSTRLGFDGDTNNTFEIDDFFYRFPIGNTTVWVAPRLGADTVINTLSPVESSGGGSVSRFGRYPAAIRIGGTNFLLGTRFTLPQGQLNLMYGSNNPAGVSGEGGIFAGGNSKLAAQIVWQPNRNFDLGFTYSYDYLAAANLGSGTNTAGEILPGAVKMNANTILGQLRWSFARNVNLFAWGSWTFASTLPPTAAINSGNTGTFTSWMAGLSFADLLNRGDLAGIMFGQPFYLASFSGNNNVNPFTSSFYTTPYHLEAFYRFRVTGNISITPAVFFVFNPNNDSRNGTATVGVLRTTFTF
ncbi:MAG: iron uptake porin, partial [Pseudanabaenaceae cyanobacterium]